MCKIRLGKTKSGIMLHPSTEPVEHHFANWQVMPFDIFWHC